MQKKLIGIHCPYIVTSKKNGKKYPCKSLCVRVAQGSQGEAYCRKCKQTFEFETGSSHDFPTMMLGGQNDANFEGGN